MTKTPEIWDAVVIGAGATGSVAALKLSSRGLRVLVLEAGPEVSRAHYGSLAKNFSRQLYRHFVSRRQEVQKRHATYWTTNPDFFVDDVDHPYTTPADKPFRWIRGYQVGGRSLLWDGVTPRFSDYEFKAASRDGIGEDWPISHADLAPYYAELERLFGVHGSRDGLAQLPDGDYRTPRPFTAAERVFRRRIEARFPGRHVLNSRGIRASRRPPVGEQHSRLSSQATTLEAALRTGRVTIRPHSVATRISMKGDGSGARGVEFVDTLSKQQGEVRGRTIFLCASTIESLVLLLGSGGHAYPGGLGASSGVLGHYLMDHVASNFYFHLPDVPDGTERHELLGSDSILIPRYQNLDERAGEFARGFGFWGGIQRLGVPRLLRKKRGEAFGFLCARAEVLPHFDNRVTLDPKVRDVWGRPAPHIVCEWKEGDMSIARAAEVDALEMIEAAGGHHVSLSDLFHMPVVGGFVRALQGEWLRSTPGLFVHEVGGARMGTSPTNSVVNSFNRMWEAPNVFVVDGACWPSCGWQNPTLTEMAITARACDHAADEMASGKL